MSALRVVLHHGTSWVARAIRWQTRSHWNHASVCDQDGWLWEAIEGRGVVHERTLADARQREEVAVFAVPHLTDAGAWQVRAFLSRQIGKPYDYGMVARFVTREQADRRESGKWFCSELVFAALREGGVSLLARIEPWAVSPQHLAISPRLVPDADR